MVLAAVQVLADRLSIPSSSKPLALGLRPLGLRWFKSLDVPGQVVVDPVALVAIPSLKPRVARVVVLAVVPGLAAVRLRLLPSF